MIKTIKLLGYGGLIPFIVTLAMVYVTSGNPRAFFLTVFIAYSAAILSFVGAVHWGFILSADDNEKYQRLLIISVVPSLVAWVVMLCPPLFGLILLAFAFPSLFVYERFSALSVILPDWYLLMRVQLTLLVTIMQFMAMGLAV